MESLVPVSTLPLVEIRMANELQGMKWMGLVVEFAFLDLVSWPVYVRYRIGMADRDFAWSWLRLTKHTSG
jgi:hypothetical protein